MTKLAIVLGISFMFFCMGFVVMHSKQSRRVMLLHWTALGLGGIYGGGWALVAFVTQNGGNPLWAPWLLPYESMYIMHTLSAFALFGAVYIGWTCGKTLRFKLSKKTIVNGGTIYNRLTFAAWTLLFISLVMQWLYTRAYGGFIGLLELSSFIRSGIFIIANPLSFLQPFGGLAIFSSFLFFGLWLDGSRRFGIRIGLILAFVFSLYILYSWLGRIAFLVYLSTFVLGVFLKRQTKLIPLLFGGGLIMLGILLAAYQISSWLNLKAADNLILFLARELGFLFASFFAQIDSGEHLMRLFRDFLYAPFYLLPSSWWVNWIEDVSQINTAIIMGAPKGEQGVTGGIPVDLLTLGLMQMSALGIAGVGFLFGVSLRVIQHWLDKVQSFGVRAVFEAYVAIKLAILGVFYAQPALVVSGNFDLLVSVAIITLYVISPRVRFIRSASNISAIKSTYLAGRGREYSSHNYRS